MLKIGIKIIKAGVPFQQTKLFVDDARLKSVVPARIESAAKRSSMTASWPVRSNSHCHDAVEAGKSDTDLICSPVQQ